MFLAIIEKISYAVTRGAIKAIWEELRKPTTAINEEATDEDAIIEARVRRRFAQLLQGDGDGDPGSDGGPPDRGAGDGQGMA